MIDCSPILAFRGGCNSVFEACDLARSAAVVAGQARPFRVIHLHVFFRHQFGVHHIGLDLSGTVGQSREFLRQEDKLAGYGQGGRNARLVKCNLRREHRDKSIDAI